MDEEAFEVELEDAFMSNLRDYHENDD